MEEPQFRADPEDRARIPRERRTLPWLLAVVVVAAVLVAAWLWWPQDDSLVARRGEVALVPTAPPADPEAPPAPAQPGIQHPLPAEATDAQPIEASAIPAALGELLGSRAVENFLQVDDFPRRFVATVDNLGRSHAPPILWPIAPTPGRFLVEERPEGTVIAPANAARYTPLVLLVGTIDARSAVRLYGRMYPVLQQAYRALGFGDRYLNDRMVEVIDLLLATPDLQEPPRVHLTEVKGPIPSVRPWVRYQFVDPALEELSAGQKILVRVGPVNQRRLKSKLRELREQLVQAAPAVPAGR